MFHYTRDEFSKALRSLGVKEGDALLCSTSLGLLGLPEGAKCQEDVDRLCFDVLAEAVGEKGTLFVPAYSYTFCKSTASCPATYDPASTPSEIGPFPEFFRNQRGVRRSLDPLFSYSGLGPAAPALFDRLPHTSYGNDCLFERFLGKRVKICNIGIGTGWALFIHHVDWLCASPFRYEKLFFGNIKVNDELRPTSWVYYVALRHPAGRVSSYKIGDDAAAEGVFSFAALGRGRIYVADYDEYYQYMLRRKRVDVWVTAQGPAGDPVRLEVERVGNAPMPVLSDENDLSDVLRSLPRDCVSDGFDRAVALIARKIPLKVHEFPTGTSAFSWLVPEKWTCFEGGLFSVSGEPIWKAEGSGRVMPYSLPFDGIVSREELFLHVKSDVSSTKERMLYRRDWGLLASSAEMEAIEDAQYLVRIRSDFSFGRMKVGEAVLPGERKEFFLVCVSLEGRGNEGVAPSLAALRLFEMLNGAFRRFSYRFLFVPGEVGAAAWLSVNEDIFELCRGILLFEDFASVSPDALQKKVDKPFVLRNVFEHFYSAGLLSDVSDGTVSGLMRMFVRCGLNDILSLMLEKQGADRDGGEKLAKAGYDLLSATGENCVPLPLYKGMLCVERYPELDCVAGSPLTEIPYLLNGERDVLELAELTRSGYFDIVDFLFRMENCGLVERRFGFLRC